VSGRLAWGERGPAALVAGEAGGHGARPGL
jgi:hypothetical protein